MSKKQGKSGSSKTRGKKAGREQAFVPHLDPHVRQLFLEQIAIAETFELGTGLSTATYTKLLHGLIEQHGPDICEPLLREVRKRCTTKQTAVILAILVTCLAALRYRQHIGRVMTFMRVDDSQRVELYCAALGMVTEHEKPGVLATMRDIAARITNPIQREAARLQILIASKDPQDVIALKDAFQTYIDRAPRLNGIEFSTLIDLAMVVASTDAWEKVIRVFEMLSPGKIRDRAEGELFGQLEHLDRASLSVLVDLFSDSACLPRLQMYLQNAPHESDSMDEPSSLETP